jgi:hypothetical protein
MVLIGKTTKYTDFSNDDGEEDEADKSLFGWQGFSAAIRAVEITWKSGPSGP